jgi:hypothetical protein
MVGRLAAALVFALILVALTNVAQGLALLFSVATGFLWWAAAIVIAAAAFGAVRAPTPQGAWGRLLLLDGLLWLALVPPSFLVRASVMQEDYRPEMVSGAAVRYAVKAALSGYLPAMAIGIALILIAVSMLLLLGPRGSKRD